MRRNKRKQNSEKVFDSLHSKEEFKKELLHLMLLTQRRCRRL